MVFRIRWIYFQNENALLFLLFNSTERTFVVEIVYPTPKRKLETILVIGRYGDWGHDVFYLGGLMCQTFLQNSIKETFYV